MTKIGVALVGCGAITLQNHLPGLALCRDTQVVALCDSDPAVLQRASQQTGIRVASTDYPEIVSRDDVQAVIIATPNVTHAPMALAAIAAGKHVLCEKPIAMSYAEALEMYRAAEAAGVRHMSAFTYRFVPGMRYLTHLVKSGVIGQPWHFRAQRFQDWGDRPLGWRQVSKLAGTGELGDMLSHRIDYAHLLVGQMQRVVAQTRRFIDNRQGHVSDLEDWVALLGDFENDATGVLESTKLATGSGEGARSKDYCEINGSEGTLVYHLGNPHEIHRGHRGGSALKVEPVPKEFLKYPGSPRDPADGDPLIAFRYDQNFEFIEAIRNQRPCEPSFYEGARAQAVMDSAIQSAREKRWIDVPKG